MNLFFRDAGSGLDLSWDDLIRDIFESGSYQSCCQSGDYYTVFKHIILSLYLGEKVILLDPAIPEKEVKILMGKAQISHRQKRIFHEKIDGELNKKNLLHVIEKKKFLWRITMLTSGTTGSPKLVTHSFDSMCRFVKKSQETNVWGFAFNPLHFAGLQVFFQAFLNGNSIIRLFGLPYNVISDEIRNYKITHISATPTFFRLLKPVRNVHHSVVRITTGGELFDPKLSEHIHHIFPSAKVTNIYAITEAGTLFAAEDDVFTIKPAMLHLTRIENDELLVHHSLVGDMDEDNGEWYSTGDLVEIVQTHPLQFRIRGRQKDMINVGGYKVNSNEIEEIIRNIPGISDVRVYARNNSVTGNIICCDVIRINPDLSEQAIRLYLQKRIQEYKIPRIIHFVDEILVTRSGKIRRTES